MKPEQDPLEDWLAARRGEATPELPRDFAERLTQRLSIAKSLVAASPKIWAMRVAAIFIIGVVGFLRMELFTILMIAGA